MNREEFLEFQFRMEAMKAIIKLNDPEKYQDLSKRDSFWSPEIRPSKYSQWVNLNYVPNPDDIVSLSVYSLLMNMPLEDLRRKMIEDFGTKCKSK